MPNPKAATEVFYEFDTEQDAIAYEEYLVKDALKSESVWLDPSFNSEMAKLQLLVGNNRTASKATNIPIHLIQWNRINQGHVNGCYKPMTFDSISKGHLYTHNKKEFLRLCSGSAKDGWFMDAISLLVNTFQFQCTPTVSHPLSSCLVSDKYCSYGIYTVKLYVMGRWCYVFVDDTVPCDGTGTPLFGRCTNANHAWVLILEKALAKLWGGYHNIQYGKIDDGIRLLTGQSPTVMSLLDDNDSRDSKEQKNSWTNRVEIAWQKVQELLDSRSNQTFICSLANAKESPMTGAPAVVVDDLFEIVTSNTMNPTTRLEDESNVASKTAKLVRLVGAGLVNPRGELADMYQSSVPPGSLPAEIVESLDLESRKKIEATLLLRGDVPLDASYFVTWFDFCSLFDSVVVYSHPLVVPSEYASPPLALSCGGSWEYDSETSGCGGCPNDLESFLTNPMLGLHVETTSDCEIVLETVGSLAAGGGNHGPGTIPPEPQWIGFQVFRGHGKHSFEALRANNSLVNRTGALVGYTGREFRQRYHVGTVIKNMSAGNYVIVPCTYEKDISAQFLCHVRVFPRDSGKQDAESSSDSKIAGETKLPSPAPVIAELKLLPDANSSEEKRGTTRKKFVHVPEFVRFLS